MTGQKDTISCDSIYIIVTLIVAEGFLFHMNLSCRLFCMKLYSLKNCLIFSVSSKTLVLVKALVSGNMQEYSLVF